MRLTFKKNRIAKNTCINSYDIMGFKGLGTWFNAYGVSYIGTLDDYDKLLKTNDLTPFNLIQDFNFLGTFHIDNLSTKFGKWVDTE
jgi:hypothetical protein